ncbi:MAG: LysR family transcriptional regulator [Oscillospiraceae bacterium]|nr:LysR family transcriptional regulator [Oscillospiraceae bacterium]
MSERQLSYFLAVYQFGSIKLAAEELMISQQALSKMIKLLENELGVTLFIRQSNKLVPTSEAVQLRYHATNIQKEWDCIHKLDPNEWLPWKTIKVYTVENVEELLGFDFWMAFHKFNPNVLLNLMRVTEEEAVEKLEEGECDFAIITKPMPEHSYESVKLYTDEFFAVINKKNPLSNKQIISFDDLDNQKIAAYGRYYPHFVNVNRMLYQKHINVTPLLEVNNNKWILQMAENNYAIGFLLGSVVKSITSDKVVIRPQIDPVCLNYYLCRSSGGNLDANGRHLRKFIVEWLGNSQKDESQTKML